MPELVSRVVRYAIGSIYMLSGVSKLYPFTDAMATELREEFTAFARVYPTVPLGYAPDPKFYLVSLGLLELSFGLGLLVGPQWYKRLCCGGLLFLMAGGVQTMLCLGRVGMAGIPLAMMGALAYIWRSLSSTDEDKKQQ